MARPHKSAEARLATRVTVRFNAAEAAELSARAETAGLAVSELIRRAVLSAPRPRRRAAPIANAAELGRLLGAVGRIGSNVNQLARTANLGGWPEADALAGAVADIRKLRAVLMRALGVSPEPGEAPPADVQPLEANER